MMMTSWSMYRVVGGVLAVILGAAAAFSAVGWVGFSSAGIIVTVVVAIAGVLLGSTVGRLVVRVPLHLESSVITGLLIAAIVPPTLDPVDIIGAVSAGLLAGLSKYLIAVNGRHLVNPAATGVLVASFFGLTAGFWWVANPPLAPLIIIGGLIVAYRAGVVPVIGVFLAIALPLLAGRLLLSGEPLWVTIWLVITSYPVVFLGFFMLSEPLTLPVRRWQQYVVAAVVAVGVALPFSVPFGGGFTLYSSPELVLVAGNLVGWFLVAGARTRRASTFTISSIEPRSPDVSEFTLRLHTPLRLLPGQWVEVHLPHKKSDSRGVRRVFSISSDPHLAQGQSPTVTIATRQAEPGSTFKKALFEDKPGASGRITQVGGEFLPPSGAKPMVLVAGGIGITPFVSWLNATSSKPRQQVWLIVVTKTPGEVLYPELERLSGVTVINVASVGDVEGVIFDLPKTLTNCHVAVSGSPGFVAAAKKLLKLQGARKVATDQFIGY